jgi:hypothetical protein
MGQSALAEIRAVFRIRAVLIVAIAAVFALTSSTAARAATITVNSLADPGRTGICALRDAVTAVNTKKATHGCAAGTGSDQIVFSVKGTINLANALPNVTDKQLTVTGPITISGQNKTKIVSVASYATLHLVKLTMTEGLGAYDPVTGNYEGGAVWNSGTVTLYNTAFNSNTAFDSNGNDTGSGGAIYNKGSLTVTNSTFTGNVADDGTAIFNAGKLTIGNSGFSNNGPGYAAGSIRNEGSGTVSSSTFTNNNSEGCCGAIWNDGTLTVTTSTFSGNIAEGGAGAVYNLGTMTITKSTFTRNRAGGVANFGGAIDNSGPMTIINSTFFGNSASYGGAISNGGPLAVTNSTFAGNSAFDGSTIDTEAQQAAVFKNTILADGSGDDCRRAPYTPITDAGYNISDDSTCNFSATGSQNNTNPGLSSAGLANNGGPTQTIALVPGSLAIDAIPLAACTDQTGKRITTDQRGFPRPNAGEAACDIGAYESSF